MKLENGKTRQILYYLSVFDKLSKHEFENIIGNNGQLYKKLAELIREKVIYFSKKESYYPVSAKLEMIKKQKLINKKEYQEYKIEITESKKMASGKRYMQDFEWLEKIILTELTKEQKGYIRDIFKDHLNNVLVYDSLTAPLRNSKNDGVELEINKIHFDVLQIISDKVTEDLLSSVVLEIKKYEELNNKNISPLLIDLNNILKPKKNKIKDVELRDIAIRIQKITSNPILDRLISVSKYIISSKVERVFMINRNKENI